MDGLVGVGCFTAVLLPLLLLLFAVSISRNFSISRCELQMIHVLCYVHGEIHRTPLTTTTTAANDKKRQQQQHKKNHIRFKSPFSFRLDSICIHCCLRTLRHGYFVKRQSTKRVRSIGEWAQNIKFTMRIIQALAHDELSTERIRFFVHDWISVWMKPNNNNMDIMSEQGKKRRYIRRQNMRGTRNLSN